MTEHPDEPIDTARRFGGSARLLGDDGLTRLRAGHVVVVGLGGVGSWAAEALARTGVGRLTLIDEDMVAESNVNRQVHALTDTLGAAKVTVMQQRLAQISDARVDIVEEFVTPDNAATLLDAGADVIIDAIDRTSVKAAMIVLARTRGQAIIVCGAAGGRVDPLRLTSNDLALTEGDALLASVRKRLRRHHGFSRKLGRRFGVLTIHSTEQAAGPESEGAGNFPLACAGYGSIMTVTAAMGLAAAARAIGILTAPKA